MPDPKARLRQDAEDKLASLLASARSARRRRGLTILAEVLRDRLDRDENSFNVKAVARESADRGGPSKQTILNRPGAEYRDLIHAFARVNGSPKPGRVRPADYEADLAARLGASISDPHVRAEVLMVISENRSFKRQMDILRHQISSGLVVKLSTSDLTLPTLSDVETEALRSFISPANLDQHDWLISDDGRLVTSSGTEIAKVGVLSALRRILSFASPPKG